MSDTASDPTSTPIVTQSPSDKLVRMRLALGQIKTACLYVIGAMMGLDWSELSTQQKVLIALAGIAQLVTHWETFFDKTAARSEQGKAAIATGNTPAPFVSKPLQ